MSSKVLVADDSLTIQKVIGITLANSGYQLVDCLSENDLENKIKNDQYDLVLLDFNLSDTKSGYDLAKFIKKEQPQAQVLILLGTFDTIEEGKFQESGIADKIVKPFESSKFIKKCKQLLEEREAMPESSVSFLDEKSDEASLGESQTLEDNLDAWVVDAPKSESVKEEVEDILSSAGFKKVDQDPLNNEIEGWGFANTSTEVQMGPSVIGEDDFTFSTIVPEEISVTGDQSNDVLSRLQSSSNFDLEELDDDQKDDDDTDPHFILEDATKREILESVDEEISPDSFWAVDDVQPIQTEESYKFENASNVGLDIQEITADLTEVVNEFKAHEHFESSQQIKLVETHEAPVNVTTNVVIDEEKIIRELKNHLTPLIEKWVKEACSETVEKVSWEVIPDLAENLIRKEIKELSDSVRH